MRSSKGPAILAAFALIASCSALLAYGWNRSTERPPICVIEPKSIHIRANPAEGVVRAQLKIANRGGGVLRVRQISTT